MSRRSEKVKAYVDKKGRSVKSHIRNKITSTPDKFKKALANTILAGIAWKVAGKPTQKLGNYLSQQVVAKVPQVNRAVRTSRVLLTRKINKRVKNLHSSKFYADAVTGLVLGAPVAVASARATQQGAKAIGWAVDQNKEENKGKIKIRVRY